MSYKKLYFVSFFIFLLIFTPLSFADTVTYKYDHAGRLTEANYGTRAIQYTYDNAGNLIEQEVRETAVNGDGDGGGCFIGTAASSLSW